MRLPIGPARLTIDKTTRAEFFLRDLAGAAVLLGDREGGQRILVESEDLRRIDTKCLPTPPFYCFAAQETLL